MKYTFELRKAYTGLGDTHVFRGPGLGRFCSEVHLVQDSDAAEGQAQQVTHLLDTAFEAGRDSMREEFRGLLGIQK